MYGVSFFYPLYPYLGLTIPLTRKKKESTLTRKKKEYLFLTPSYRTPLPYLLLVRKKSIPCTPLPLLGMVKRALFFLVKRVKRVSSFFFVEVIFW